MIQNLRQYADNWYFKGFLGLVVFGFVFLGVGDLIRSLVYDRPIAVVGDSSISMEELDRTLRTELKRIQVTQKVQVNLSDLEQYGFIEKMLEKLIAQHVLTQELERLHVVVSDTTIQNNVKSLQPFLKDGVFDPSLFDTFLKNTGLTEQGLVRDMRKQIMDQQYFLSFSLAATLPDFYKDVLLKAMLQKRVFAAVTIDASKMTLTDKILDADVEAFYNENKEIYKKAESKDIQVLILNVADLAKKITVPETDLKEAFENRKDLYATPEKRSFKKIMVPTQEAAEQVIKVYKESKTLDAVLKTVKDVKIEEIKPLSLDMIKGQAEDLFKLKQAELSGIMAEDMGFAIYMVDKISPASKKTFDDVKAELVKDVQIERYQDDFKKLKNKLEDDLAGGRKLDDMAKELNMSIVTLKDVGMDGKGLTDKALNGFEKDVLEQAQQLGENNASNIIDVTSDKSIVVFVQKVIAEHLPEFSAIKKNVTEDYTNYQKRVKASKIAQEIAIAKNVGQMAELASKNSVTLKTNITFSRMQIAEDKSLQENGAIMIYDRAFALPIGKAIAGPVKEGFLILMPEKEVEKSQMDQSKKDELLKRFDGLMHESMANLLIESLKKRYKVDIKKDRLEAYKKMVNKDAA
ncbi:MAG: Peptidyl-prolyl cis-trans isomerase D [Holosporales bacterium]